jgi:hypothetical protein
MAETGLGLMVQMLLQIPVVVVVEQDLQQTLTDQPQAALEQTVLL